MITQKQMKEWIPEAVEHFKAAMSPIDVPYPEIFIASANTEDSVREELVEMTHSPVVEVAGPSYMEYLHGDRGNAIIVYQRRFNNRGWERNAKERFQHMLWHELGHFYAVSSEDPNDNYARFLNLTFAEGEYPLQVAYLFWSEFIAEAIACRVAPEPSIDWKTANWRPYRSKLEANAQCVVLDPDDRESVYSLSIYLATLLADKGTRSFIEAANDGMIKEESFGRLSMGLGATTEKTLSDKGIDPCGLDCVPKPYIKCIKVLQDKMAKHLQKDQYWLLTQSELLDYSFSTDVILILRQQIRTLNRPESYRH